MCNVKKEGKKSTVTLGEFLNNIQQNLEKQIVDLDSTQKVCSLKKNHLNRR